MEKENSIKGWNTWDTYCATSYINMPEGYGIRVGIKEYLRGQYLEYPNIGKMEEKDEKIRPGLHAYDGSYTEMELKWCRLTFSIQTAVENDYLIVRVSLVKNTTRFVPAVVFQGIVLWNFPAVCEKKDGRLFWKTPSGIKEAWVITGTEEKDTYMPISGSYIAVKADEDIIFSVGRQYTQKEAMRLLHEKRKKLLDYAKKKYGGYGDCWLAMQTSLAWNMIYDSMRERILVNVSRLWNIDRGGYAQFCWDNFFMGLMMAADNPELGKNNIIQNLKEIEKLGFVPNVSCGNGRKSFDRSQPPVGSICVWEIYRIEGDIDFLKDTFDLLLKWNRWWEKERCYKGMLCWGSNKYDNKWEMDGIHDTFGAALESGMDNSPMYCEDEAAFNKMENVIELWDVALNSLYIYDCQILSEIAKILEREEQKELSERGEQLKLMLNNLWNDEMGIYCNYRTDTGVYSKVLTPCNFYPMMTGAPTREQVQRMMKEHFNNTDEFAGEWILPSVSKNHPMYQENDYWRGRIWAPLNFLVYLGFRKYPDLPEKEILINKSLRLFMREWQEHRHIHENYNAETGYGDDVKNSDRNYAWGGLLAYITLMDKKLV